MKSNQIVLLTKFSGTSIHYHFIEKTKTQEVEYFFQLKFWLSRRQWHHLLMILHVVMFYTLF